jgi:hypothetical protein
MVEVKYTVITLILCFVAFKVLTKQFDLLDAFVVLLPFKSISFELGLSVYAAQIPILLLFFKRGSSKKNLGTFFKNDIFLLAFLTYVAISTLVISNFFIDKFVKNDYFDTFLRGEGRYIAILIRFLFFDFGIIYLIYLGVKDTFKVPRLIKMYLYGLTALSFLGIIQVSLSIFIGDIFPNLIDAEGKGVNDIVQLAGSLPFVRLTSLGGEPKNLGCSLSVGVMLLVFLSRQKITLFKYQKYTIWLFIICIIFSLSTSGFGLLFMLLGVSILTGIGKQSFWRFEKSYLFTIPILTAVISIFWNFLNTVFVARIIDRSYELANEEVDSVIIKFLLDNPGWAIVGSGVGNIHNLVIPYLGDESFSNALQNNIFMSRYGYIKLISENGLIGFVLFLLAFSSILLKLNARKRKDSFSKMFFYSVLTLIFFYFMRSNYIISELMLVTGLALAHLSVTKEQLIPHSQIKN